jgi:ubiquitin-activating enzyme E1
MEKQFIVNKFCNENNIKLIITDCYGPYGKIFNDFGKNFEVIDKNGE